MTTFVITASDHISIARGDIDKEFIVDGVFFVEIYEVLIEIVTHLRTLIDRGLLCIYGLLLILTDVPNLYRKVVTSHYVIWVLLQEFTK